MVIVFFLVVIAVALIRAGQQNHTLTVTGHPGELPVVEIGGRSYVEIEALTRLASGSLRFLGNQIILTLPGPAPATSVPASASSQPGISGFSKEFLRAGIEQMAAIREWRSALINAIRQGNPVTEDWTANFHAEAQQNLRLASVAVSTDSDRHALQLLTNEFNYMKALSDRFVEANRSRTYVPPNALENDPVDQKILNCGHALAAMVSNNQFVDDGSCH